MKNNPILSALRCLALSCNILFILWILYNGINEGFEGTIPEKLSYIGLMILLAMNSILLLNREKQPHDPGS